MGIDTMTKDKTIRERVRDKRKPKGKPKPQPDVVQFAQTHPRTIMPSDKQQSYDWGYADGISISHHTSYASGFNDGYDRAMNECTIVIVQIAKRHKP